MRAIKTIAVFMGWPAWKVAKKMKASKLAVDQYRKGWRAKHDWNTVK